MPRNLRIRTAAVFSPLLQPSRYKGIWGGRGSGKSHFYAGAGIEKALMTRGCRIMCIREVQKSLKDSAKKLIEDKLQEFGLGEGDGFKVFNDVIETPGDGLMTFEGMKDHTADSIKSKEGFDVAWVEEAQSLSMRSLTLLRPTMRKDGSELWFSWNPERPTDAVDMLLRSSVTPSDVTVLRANWSDNPWFPKVLEQERQDCLAQEPERYGHIWEGEYATVLEGAYFARHLIDAQAQGRICPLHRDPLMKVYAFWDIGGTSKKSDATAIWIAQFTGDDVKILDYYEAVGQPFEAHVHWLKGNGWTDAVCVLPHDGARHDVVYAATPEGYLSKAGFLTETVRNQGAGAALQRIEAVRRLFPRIKFHAEKTKPGREALGWYHSRIDEKRRYDLGPEHDWSSHAADAFGLLAVWETLKPDATSWGKPMKRNLKGVI